MRIHILASLFLTQLFAACQQNPEKLPTATAKIDFQSPAAFTCNQEAAALPADSIVFQSTDGGQTWRDISAGLPRDLGVRDVLADGGQLFLSTGNGLYHSPITPAAANWEKEFLMQDEIAGVFPGWDGRFVYSYERGVFQEAIIGTGAWKHVFENLKSINLNQVLQTDKQTIFVTAFEGIFKSVDGGINWKQVYTDGWVRSLVAEQGVMIAGGMHGVLRSTDNGEHWTRAVPEDEEVNITSFWGGRFFAVSFGNNTAKENMKHPERNRSWMRSSADGGNTWQNMDENLGAVWLMYNDWNSKKPQRQITDVAQVGDYLFCSLQAGVFRSADQGKTWEFMLPCPIGNSTYRFAVSGKTIYAVKTLSGC